MRKLKMNYIKRMCYDCGEPGNTQKKKGIYRCRECYEDQRVTYASIILKAGDVRAIEDKPSKLSNSYWNIQVDGWQADSKMWS